MSWDGKGFEKPLILIETINVADTISENIYKKDEEMEDILKPDFSSEDVLYGFHETKKTQDGCKYLAYSIHKRAGVWWAYQCLKSVKEEIDEAKAKGIDKNAEMKKQIKNFTSFNPPELEAFKNKQADMSTKLEEEHKKASKRLNLPHLMKNPDDPQNEYQKKFVEMTDLKSLLESKKNMDNYFTSLPAEEQAEINRFTKRAKNNFKKMHRGISFEDAVRCEIGAQPKFKIEELDLEGLQIPKDFDKEKKFELEKIFDKLKEQHKAGMDYHKQQMEEHFPLDLSMLPKGPSKKKIDNAFKCAIKWIIAPTEINAKNARESGNDANGTPEGLLALCAFWGHGDLAVDNENIKKVITSPPGVTSNGINSVLLQAALLEGGTRKPKERYEVFYNLGLGVAQGINLWDDEVLKTLITQDKKNIREGSGDYSVNYTKSVDSDKKSDSMDRAIPQKKDKIPIQIKNSPLPQGGEQKGSWINRFKNFKS